MSKFGSSLLYFFKSICAILALAILVHYVTLPDITHDKLLISIFGGFFLGAGIGLTIRGGGVIDGTEVLAITVSRKSSLTVGDFIAVFNILSPVVSPAMRNRIITRDNKRAPTTEELMKR